MMALHPLVKHNSFPDVISNFEKIIARFEKKEMTHFFENISITKKKSFYNSKENQRKKLPLYQVWDTSNKIFNKSSQSSIYKYWREKQERLKRPLLRCYWRAIHNPFSGFGPQDMKKFSFAPRPSKKKKTRIFSRCLKGNKMIEKLEEFKEEMEQMRFLVKMTTIREKLKLQKELMIFGTKDKSINTIYRESNLVLHKTRKILENLPEDFEECDKIIKFKNKKK